MCHFGVLCFVIFVHRSIFWTFLSTFLPPLESVVLAVVFLVFGNLIVLFGLSSIRYSLVFTSDQLSSPFHPAILLIPLFSAFVALK